LILRPQHIVNPPSLRSLWMRDSNSSIDLNQELRIVKNEMMC
jgi:hypothetical protein